MLFRQFIPKLPNIFYSYYGNSAVRLSTVANVNNMKYKIEEKRKSAHLGGGLKRIDQQHAKVCI